MDAIAEHIECSAEDTTKAVRDLIRLRRVVRHHVGPGELRYGLAHGVTPGSRRRVHPMPRVQTPRAPYQHASPKQDRVLAILGTRAMTTAMIVEASEFTPKQVSNLLSSLRRRGLVSHSGGRWPHWSAV